jgi:hypothetical protein
MLQKKTVSSISSSSALVVPLRLAVDKGTVWAPAQSELQVACGHLPFGAVSRALEIVTSCRGMLPAC